MLDGDTEEHTRTSNQEECHPTDIVPMEGIANLQNTDPYLFAISSEFYRATKFKWTPFGPYAGQCKISGEFPTEKKLGPQKNLVLPLSQTCPNHPKIIFNLNCQCSSIILIDPK